jgi:glycosyltransferase involved in cell wall biosynthesis
VRSVLQSASMIVNVTPFWSELDAQMFNRPVATIPNGFDEEEFPSARPERNERFTIVNVGNLWPEMRPETFFEALTLLRSCLGDERFTRTLRFVYRGLAHERMNALAHAADVSKVVDIGPFVPRSEALRLLCQADALLLFSMPPSVRDPYLKRGVYPGKVFEYFGAKRPILCVPGDGAQLDELLVRTGTGTVCATSEEVSSWLAGRIKQWESHTTAPYSPVQSERASYSRVALAAQLGALLDAAIDGAR